MAPDLIIYAIVAAALVFWLRSILGTRHGDERERPNPFTIQAEAPKPAREGLTDGPVEAMALSSEDRVMQLAANPTKVVSVDNKTAEQGLVEIARADKTFDINFFMEGAQEAFVMVVEAFAKGDKETLRDLLGDSVYKIFEGAITEREARGETMTTEILAVRKADVIEAKMQGRTAFITVRFKADETEVTRDKNGEVIAGHPERVVSMRDIWVLSRDVKGRDPRWLVTETRGDFEGDNEIIPNSN